MRQRRSARGWGGRSVQLVGALVMALSVGTATASGAPAHGPQTVIEVFPGNHAIANALAGASSGDTLSIHTGMYPEHFSVTKDAISLVAAGDGPVTIDGECNATWTVNVSGDGVSLRNLSIIGGNFGELTFSGAASGKAQGIRAKDTCGAAEYGINVFLSGSIELTANVTTGFTDAGIYIGAITSTPLGPLVVQRNDSFGNERGIIVEDSSGGDIRVDLNRFHDNVSVGIWIHNTDGASFRRNTVTDNSEMGIDVDPTSDDNLVIRNRASGHRFDLANEGGTGNCFLDNSYTTSLGEITC